MRVRARPLGRAISCRKAGRRGGGVAA